VVLCILDVEKREDHICCDLRSLDMFADVQVCRWEKRPLRIYSGSIIVSRLLRRHTHMLVKETTAAYAFRIHLQSYASSEGFLRIVGCDR
jgi:hypothetical protein